MLYLRNGLIMVVAFFALWGVSPAAASTSTISSSVSPVATQATVVAQQDTEDPDKEDIKNSSLSKIKTAILIGIALLAVGVIVGAIYTVKRRRNNTEQGEENNPGELGGPTGSSGPTNPII